MATHTVRLEQNEIEITSSKIDAPTGILVEKGNNRPETTGRRKKLGFALITKKQGLRLVDSPPKSNPEVDIPEPPRQAHCIGTNPHSEKSKFPEATTATKTWYELQIDTNRLPGYAFKIPQDPPSKAGFRARMRQTARGILIRIVRRLSDVVEEVADIHLEKSGEPYELDGAPVTIFELGSWIDEPDEPGEPDFYSLPVSSALGNPTSATTASGTLVGTPLDISPYPASPSGPTFSFAPPELDPTDLREVEEPISSVSADGLQGHWGSITTPSVTPEDTDDLQYQSRRTLSSRVLVNPRSPSPGGSTYSEPAPSPTFSFASTEPESLIRQPGRPSTQSGAPEPKLRVRQLLRPIPPKRGVAVEEVPSDRQVTAHLESWPQRRHIPKVRHNDVAADERASLDVTSTEIPSTADINRDGDQNYTAVEEIPDLILSAVKMPSTPNPRTDDQSSAPETPPTAPQSAPLDGPSQRSKAQCPISSSGILANSIVIHRGLNKWIQATAYDYGRHDWTLGHDFEISNPEESQLALPFSEKEVATDHVSDSVDLGPPADLSQWIAPLDSDVGHILSPEVPENVGMAQDTRPQRLEALERSQEYPNALAPNNKPLEGNVLRQRRSDSQSTSVTSSWTVEPLDPLTMPSQTPILPHHHNLEGANVAELSTLPDLSFLDIDKASRSLSSPSPSPESSQPNDIQTTLAARFFDPISSYLKLILIATSTSLFHLAQGIFHRQQTKSRVRSSYELTQPLQKCGQQLFDDFIERRPGAAKDLEDHLNRHLQDHAGNANSSSPASSPSASRTDSQSTHLSSQTSPSSVSPNGDIGLSGASRYNSMILENRMQPTVVPLSGFSEPRWLLTCASGERHTTKLLHVDVNAVLIKSDRDLVTRLRQRYLQLRAPWLRALRLRGLTTIQFVQFEVHHSRAVDIRKCPDMPPPSAANYVFEPSDLLPPVGENYLIHLFHHPQDYDDEYITYVRLPKKCGPRLRVLQNRDVEIGWGINLVEGFQAAKVWALAIGIFFSSSLIFGATWAARRGDVQGAFGVSAWISTLPVLLIGFVQAYWE